MTKPISLRAYAAWRKNKGLPGGSLEGVRRAIQSERLVDSVVTVDGVKKIADPEAADREWLANTDPGRRLFGLVGGDDEGESGEPSAMVQASTRLKQAQAELAELNLRKRSAELMDVADAERAWAEACARLRNALLGVANRLKQRHPEIALEYLATLDELVRATLEDLADAEPDEADDAA